MAKEKYLSARRYAGLTPGDTVRVTRELQELTQSELADRASLSQPILSAIEKGRISLGVERAKRLARALHVHPAVLLFPDWEMEKASA